MGSQNTMMQIMLKMEQKAKPLLGKVVLQSCHFPEIINESFHFYPTPEWMVKRKYKNYKTILSFQNWYVMFQYAILVLTISSGQAIEASLAFNMHGGLGLHVILGADNYKNGD